jgi:CheY-like chemotaxis protein
MKNKVASVMLIDDNDDDNLFHERVLKKSGITDTIFTATSAFEALNQLSTFEKAPALIFLDINMPQMNGFDFLDAYKRMNLSKNHNAIIIMLTTSLNPTDRDKAARNKLITEFRTKPLAKEALEEIADRYFP